MQKLQGRRTFTAKDKGLRIHVSMPTTWSNTLLLTTTNLLQLHPAPPLYLWPDKVSFLLRFFFLVANLFGFISKQLLNYPETHQITRFALLSPFFWFYCAKNLFQRTLALFERSDWEKGAIVSEESCALRDFGWNAPVSSSWSSQFLTSFPSFIS